VSIGSIARGSILALIITATSAAPATALTFGSPKSFSTGTSTSPRAVIVADLDKDGKADLATANSGVATSYVGSSSVLLGDGAGAFRPFTKFPTGRRTYGVGVGNFDRDANGKPDLVAANLNADTAAVLVGDGAGKFRSPVNFWVHDGPRVPLVTDWNGDANDDFFTVNQNGYGTTVAGTVSMWQSESGTFPTSASQCNPSGSKPSPCGGFRYSRRETGRQPYGGVVRDFDKNGTSDLATVDTAASTVSVHLRNPDRSWQPRAAYRTGASPRSIDVGDFNRDDNLDLAVANYNAGTASVLLGNGDGTFRAKRDTPVYYASARHVAVGDFNGDTAHDLAVTIEKRRRVSVLKGDGCGNFQRQDISTVDGSGPFWVSVGRFDANATDDLVTANYNSNNVSVLLNKTPKEPAPPPCGGG
jgi:hypothetical protein